MAHLLGLENGVHMGDCNLLIRQWIPAGNAGVQGSHVGQMPVSVGCFSNRTIGNIPSLECFPGIAGCFGDPLQTLMARTYFGGTKVFWLQAWGSICICSLLRLFFIFQDLKIRQLLIALWQGKLEHCWLSLGLWALCDGDEQMLGKSLISPPPEHPVSLKLHCPVQSWGQQ